MAEFKEVLKTLGYDPEEVKDLDTFKSKIDNDFVRVSTLPERRDILDPFIQKAMGKRIGVLETEIKKTAKEFGLDFETDEHKAKPIEELNRILINKSAEKYGNEVKELQAKLAAGNDENTKKLQKELDSLKQKYAETTGLLEETSKKYQDLEVSKNNELKQFKLNQVKAKAYESVKFKADISEAEKAGFEAILSQKYQLDLDDKDGLIVKDKDGNRIKNDKVVGTFKSYQDVLESEAIALKLFQVNPNGGNPAPRTNGFQAPANPSPQGQSFTKKVNPRALV